MPRWLGVAALILVVFFIPDGIARIQMEIVPSEWNPATMCGRFNCYRLNGGQATECCERYAECCDEAYGSPPQYGGRRSRFLWYRSLPQWRP